jgi:hypothetical protein
MGTIKEGGDKMAGDYSNAYDRLTTAEKIFLALNPFMIGTIRSDAEIALAEARRRFPGPGLHNGPGDAFRHCYWSALLTRDIGMNNTIWYTNAHEERSDNPPEEKEMDLFNNMRGIEIGIGMRRASNREIADRCEAAFRHGRLRVMNP